ncbi:hypothetical protein Q7P36_001203 [Cladosporium allicinum]
MLRSSRTPSPVLPVNRFNSVFRESAQKSPNATVDPILETDTDNIFRQWKPITLRRRFLFPVISVTLGLLALVQILVIYDQHHGGILFAPKISELGAVYLFLYRYLPTIIAVTYAFIWHWIDIDTRRVEPYRQLSKPGGATGSNSLLLHYPTDLLAFVPLKAFKRRHWPVVISASALLLVGMGLTPLQAAMFATETVTKTSSEPILLSNHRMSIGEQEAQITANYTYSVANIVWLDERLPPFMSREAAFTPFKLAELRMMHNDESLTGTTTAFSVDVTCEPAIRNDAEKILTSSQGCRYDYVGLYGPSWTDVVGIDVSGDDIREYTPFYAGYSGGGGNVNYYMSSSCPKNVSNIFFVALRRNRQSVADPPPPITGLFCETAYHQQDFLATVRRADGKIMDKVELGPRTVMPSELFNTSTFEEQISNARQLAKVRGALPTTDWPDQRPQLANLSITMAGSLPEMSNIFGLAVGAYPRNLEDYMDAETLASSFQAAYRLLFARAMVDVLAADYEDSERMNGTRVYQTEAVRVVERFAYAVEAVLGTVALMAFILMAVTWFDTVNLRTDPDSLSALMLLVKGQPSILEHFSQHDQSSWALLQSATSRSTFALERPLHGYGGTLRLEKSSLEADTLARHHIEDDKADFQYPFEFSMIMGCLFVLALASTLAGTSYIYQTSQANGLALPSQNRFIRQVVENYIPTIIATLIEPVWVVLNRLMCMFQPFEELRNGNALARRSVDLKYASLPPQFSLSRALGANHFVLSAVCAMALLANVLAVAFSGLLDEETLAVASPANATAVYNAQLKTEIANDTQTGNPSSFYYSMANFTSGTPMPQWTDNSAFYLPASHVEQLNQSDQLQLENIHALAVSLQCDPIDHDHGYSWTFSGDSFELASSVSVDANVTVDVLSSHGDPLRCSAGTSVSSDFYPWPCTSREIMAFEYMEPLSSLPHVNNSAIDPCQGLWLAVWARKPAFEMCGDGPYTLSDDEATAMVCRPKVTVQSVNVTLNGEHRVLEAVSETVPEVFSGSQELIKQATHALWQGAGSTTGIWHNDSFPSDWHSYVMKMMNPDIGFLDPALPPPDFDLIADMFTRAYQRTFAIWLGLDHERLLAPAPENDESIISATMRRPEIRIVVSRPMTILSSTILGLYIIVAVAVYARRPGKFLPRQPLTMASDIALFAASKAVGETDASDNSKCRREKEEQRFGYGRFIGVDGRPHIGVERVPFVIPAVG